MIAGIESDEHFFNKDFVLFILFMTLYFVGRLLLFYWDRKWEISISSESLILICWCGDLRSIGAGKSAGNLNMVQLLSL